MQGSKLYSSLQYFNKYEQNRCRKFILSPYFNSNQNLVKLFDLLIRHINTGNGIELTRENIWAELEEGRPFDDVRLRKYFSDLLKLIEGFISQETFEANPLHKATYLMEGIGQRKMAKLYNNSLRTAERLSKQQPYKPASYYFYQYQIEKNKYELKQYDRKRTDLTNIESIANNLDGFYLAEKLRYINAVLSRQYEVSHEYEILFIEEIINHIEKYDYDHVPPIAIYYQIYKALKESDNHDHYFRLKDLLEKYGLEFPKEEATSIYVFTINYCTRQINKGNGAFLREYFDLYKDLLKKEIIIVDNILPAAHFKNIVLAGCRLSEIDWTERFIDNYQQYLPANERENAVTFNRAQLYFYKKDYPKVIEQLQFVEYHDLSYNLNSKTFLLCTYYELDEIEALYSLLDSFGVFLKRHKNIPVRRRRSYKNLIRFVRRLSKILPGDEKATEKIKTDLAETKEIVSRAWLMEKINDL